MTKHRLPVIKENKSHISYMKQWLVITKTGIFQIQSARTLDMLGGGWGGDGFSLLRFLGTPRCSSLLNWVC